MDRSSGTPKQYVYEVQLDNQVDANGKPILGPFQPGLDLEFPYTNTQWTVSQSGASADAHSQPYTNVALDRNNTWTDSVAGSNSYHTWLMYQPPGGVWVPLQDITWNWGGTASLVNKVWQFPPTTSGATFSSPTSPDANTGAGNLTDIPPSWSHRVTYLQMEPGQQ